MGLMVRWLVLGAALLSLTQTSPAAAASANGHVSRTGAAVKGEPEVVVVGDLMWTVRDNGRDVTWFEAKAYCDSCRVGGYDDWEMPSEDMLRRICSIPLMEEVRDSEHWD